jgi:hypothetical protein
MCRAGSEHGTPPPHYSPHHHRASQSLRAPYAVHLCLCVEITVEQRLYDLRSNPATVLTALPNGDSSAFATIDDAHACAVHCHSVIGDIVIVSVLTINDCNVATRLFVDSFASLLSFVGCSFELSLDCNTALDANIVNRSRSISSKVRVVSAADSAMSCCLTLQLDRCITCT